MKRKSIGEYPPNWEEIAREVKDAAGWKCVRCGHIHEPEAGYTLTVHHLDIDPSNCAWWNIPALCQRCHLHIQGKVVMERMYMFAHSEWFRPYVGGYYAVRAGWVSTRDYRQSLIICPPAYIMAHIDELLESVGG